MGLFAGLTEIRHEGMRLAGCPRTSEEASAMIEVRENTIGLIALEFGWSPSEIERWKVNRIERYYDLALTRARNRRK